MPPVAAIADLPWCAYCRISDADLAELRALVQAGLLTVEQAKERERKGVLKQREDLTQLAINLGIVKDDGTPNLVWYEDNNLSAFKRKVKRKDFERMLKDLATPYARGGILAYDIDRLTRQNRDLERTIDIYEETRHKLGFHTLSGQNFDLSTPDGRFSARIMVSVANKASEDMSRRLKREMLRKAKAGETTGGHRPFGWEEDRKTPRKKEADFVDAQATAYLEGDGLTTIQKRFREAGFVGRTGKPFCRTSVRRIIGNPRNAGIRVYQGEPIKDEEGNYIIGDWEPIFSGSNPVEKWEAINAKMNATPTPQRAREQRTTTLLSGILRCGACGTRMTAAVTASKYPKYRCASDANGCGNITISRPEVERVIRNLVSEYLEREAAKVTLTKPEEEKWEKESELQEAEKELGEIKALWRDKKIKASTYALMLDDLESRIEKLKGERALARTSSLPEPTALLKTLKEGWGNLSIERQREAIRAVIVAVLVAPGNPKRRGPGIDLSRLTPVFR